MRGVNTKWESSDGVITLLELQEYASKEEIKDAKIFEALLPKVMRQEERVEEANLAYPILVSVDKGEPKVIMDGQHRVVKALRRGEEVRVRFLDLMSLPTKVKEIFGINEGSS